MAGMRSWHPEDLDWDFMRGVRAQLSPDWFWTADKVPFLLEGIAGEIRKRLRVPGDSLLIPGLGTIAVGGSSEDGTPQVRVYPQEDWKIREEER